MKAFKQVHILVYDKELEYNKVPGTPDFNSDREALKYWEVNRTAIQKENTCNDPVLLVRRETHSVAVKEL